MVYSYADLRDHLLDYLGGSTDLMNERACRVAAQNGYRELAEIHRWSYYKLMGRIVTIAPYSTGTIQYANSTRTVTLSGGVWPAWAARGVVRIDNVPYEVAVRVSDTEIVLGHAANPGADVAAGTVYQIYQETYRLPTDFVAMDDVVRLNSGIILMQVPQREWIRRQGILHSPSEPRIFCVLGDPDYVGAMAIVLSPPPSRVWTASYLYQRRPQELKVLQYAEGTASVTVSTDAVTGVGASWTEDMEGSIIRFAADGDAEQDPPSGPSGKNPSVMDRMVMEVNNATSLTLDQAADRTLATVRYAISSPLDVEDGSMLTALFRECERQLRLTMRPARPSAGEDQIYAQAIERARENDNRDLSRKYAGQVSTGRYWPRLRDFPSA